MPTTSYDFGLRGVHILETATGLPLITIAAASNATITEQRELVLNQMGDGIVKAVGAGPESLQLAISFSQIDPDMFELFTRGESADYAPTSALEVSAVNVRGSSVAALFTTTAAVATGALAGEYLVEADGTDSLIVHDLNARRTETETVDLTGSGAKTITLAGITFTTSADPVAGDTARLTVIPAQAEGGFSAEAGKYSGRALPDQVGVKMLVEESSAKSVRDVSHIYIPCVQFSSMPSPLEEKAFAGREITGQILYSDAIDAYYQYQKRKLVS